ncbi:MAG: hypothetical protein CMO01_20765 [Thalassobius sp.]|nr:hypothetical protein [Thalassovita sp.]
MNRRLLFFLLCILNVTAYAQEEDYSVEYAETIKASDLKKHLSIIASDEYEGRETGEKGQKMAAEYISKHFKGLGLEGPVDNKNPYYQPFSLNKSYWNEVSISTPNKNLTYLEDFFIYGNFNYDHTKMQTVFAGYGIDEDKYTDYEGLDVEGKAVLVLMDEPKNADGTYVISGSEKSSEMGSTNYKIKTAGDKGAAAIVFVYTDKEEFSNRLNLFKPYLQKPSLSMNSSGEGKMGLFFTNSDGGAAMLGTSSKKFDKTLKKDITKGIEKVKGFTSEIELTAMKKAEDVTTENVLGFMEGTDLKDEILVVTAHYDHIGKTDTIINNGADDDGSGTVTVLEIAEAFATAKKNGVAPRRSILFMTVTGEEKGLLGSKYYSEHPVFPLENTITDLNIDMVGRVDEKHADNPNYIYIIGSDMLSSDLHNLHETVAKKYSPDVELDYEYNSDNDPNRFYYRSDHYNFAKHGIPVIFYFNGTHPDYHRPTDTVDKIEFAKMEKVARLIFHTAWELANTDERPVVDKADQE